MRHRLLPWSAVLVGLTAGTAPAQLVAYDPFNQQLGQLNGFASSGAGSTWPSASQTWQPAAGNGGSVQSGSLSYGPLATAGNRAVFNWFSGNNASVRQFGGNQGGTDVWLSFLMQGSAGNQGLVLYNESLFTPVAYFGTPNSTTNFGMRLYEPATGTAAAQDRYVSPTVPPGGGTHLIVAHLALTAAGQTNAVTLYVDPDVSSLGAGAAPTGGSSVSYTTALPFGFDRVVLGNYSGVSGAAGAVAFDEIRVGSSWAAVSPVPEPAGLLIIAAVLPLLRRRLS